MSANDGDRTAILSPDLIACAACIAEVRTAGSRRHRYPFTTCAACGPRYSLALAMPWDRARTTMAPFPPCAACWREYADPLDRRYHAQTIACPACGPTLALRAIGGEPCARGDAALAAASARLRAGQIVAVKGVGGFQLMVDAQQNDALTALRERKRRPRRPFAVMVQDLAAARAIARVDAREAELLTSPAGPIVLLERQPDALLSAYIAPGSPLVGLLLPTTPLHQLLLDELGGPLVTTSGNRAGEPICYDDVHADDVFAGIAAAILTHDRRIHNPVDDSVARVMAGATVLLRRARGHVPVPIRIDRDLPACGAVSGHQKAAPAVACGRRVHLAPHVGDLETAAARDRLRDELQRSAAFAAVAPALLAHDRHPGYGSSRIAEGTGLPARAVQHHLAHVLGCAAEHGVRRPWLGVAFDGNGLGLDGTLWGAEFLLVSDDGCERHAWLAPFPLPGGEHAMRDPALAALGLLYANLPCAEATAIARELLPISEPRLRGHLSTLTAGRLPRTSAAGRLFDAACALLDLLRDVTFDGEAAMAVEYAAMPAWASPAADAPLSPPAAAGGPIALQPLVRALIEARRSGASAAGAALVHRFLIAVIAAVAGTAGLARVVLSGGCFQNRLLLEGTWHALRASGHDVYFPQRAPANDGGLALGQLYALSNPAWNLPPTDGSTSHVSGDSR